MSAVLTSVAALLLLSCSKQPEADNGTLKVAFGKDNTAFVSLDPFQVWWIEHRIVLRNVAESLTDQDPATGAIIPWLAKSWEISPDGLEYTFTLRDDVTFSNGSKFDASAVKTAFDADKALVEKLPTVFGATYLSGYDHADILDDHRIRLVLARPNGGFLQATSTTNLAILAPESYARSPEERSRGAIIGTGPFTLERYTPEVGLTLVKRKGYGWPSRVVKNPGEAKVERIEVSYIAEDTVRNGKFLQGSVDIIWPRAPFPDADLNLLKQGGATIESRSLPGPSLNLFPNTRNGRTLSDPVVRQAVQKAIDRPSYARTVYNPDFPVVEGPFDKTTPYFRSQKAKLVYDPAGAERLLDGAGWKKGTDGFRSKDGKRLVLRINSQTDTPGNVLLQDQLRKVGIDVQIVVLVPGEYAAAIKAGKYDLTGSYMTRGDPVILQTILDPRYSRGSALATNAFTPDLLKKAQHLFDAGLITSDPAKRAEAYGALQDLLIDQSIAFPVYERIWQAALSKNVKGFAWTAEGFASFNDLEIKR
ncbi:MAG: ABC transporter substrate-binding protein [Sphingobium sp.]